ncbi:MAG: hypothetical protein VXZ96_13720, partial [Myxococcota bacterium]|nr:hypothetical protein [Myxococcota bacterium]
MDSFPPTNAQPFHGHHDVYTVIRVIGRGAMATVFLCENSKKERIALKWLTQSHPPALTRFNQEIEQLLR